jgi:hypothetical protein
VRVLEFFDRDHALFDLSFALASDFGKRRAATAFDRWCAELAVNRNDDIRDARFRYLTSLIPEDKPSPPVAASFCDIETDPTNRPAPSQAPQLSLTTTQPA